MVKDNLGALTDDAKHEIAKSLTEKQTLECVQLESNLKGEEIKQINHFIQVGRVPSERGYAGRGGVCSSQVID